MSSEAVSLARSLDKTSPPSTPRSRCVAGDGRPTVIVTKTIKGKGVVVLEDREGWHGKALADPEAPAEAAAETPQQEEVESE